ncbi:MAG: M23 family metallopeptidase [Bacteroidales bacterium]|nr:M23 family metallopeptidase [Bacteroidales bacterium]
MGKYVFDKKQIKFRKVTDSVGNIVKTVLGYFITTVTLSIVYYAIFCSAISTDSERRLRKENRLYKKTYAEMVRKQNLIADVISGLENKDNVIYEEVFHTTAPNLYSLQGEDFLASSDSIPDEDIVNYTAAKVKKLEETSSTIEENFKAIEAVLKSKGSVMPPLSLPLADLSYVQTGASVGKKTNPFYKVEVEHGGLDFVAPQGDAVVASADGVVSSITLSRKGLGNVVEITHEGGFVTRYAHLSDIVVRKGQTVSRGKKIGSVGISGTSFIPHLHYEVIKDGVNQNPVNYFFASVSPREYAEMMYMSLSTGQSMD